ncbi:Outer membrane protein assembly factor BamA [Flavobacteriaceae bacterium MAR_2010_188]|nr:Outer membrane protein assembly factor BamA [Flavobacteriaceae bacterium MAR_2010_188]
MGYPFIRSTFLISICILFFSCNVLKRVNEGERLLTDNTVLVNDKKDNSEKVSSLIYQKPNGKLLGVPIRLHLYNLARPNIDSILQAKYRNPDDPKTGLKNFLSEKQYEALINSKKNFNSWLKRTGEAPAIIDENKAERSAVLMRKYYFSVGYFDAQTSYEITAEDSLKAKVIYNIETGQPHLLDTITKIIYTPIVDSLYTKIEGGSLIKKGEPYKEDNFENERERITTSLRNSGLYHFQEDNVLFEIDTIGLDHKVNSTLIINNRAIRVGDSTERVPFKIWKIKDVNVYPDYTYENRNLSIKDSVSYNGYHIYTYDKLRYRPKALADAIFLAKDDVYRNINITRTARYLSELNTFNYPSIEATENADTTLTYNIFLSPKKKYNLGFNFDVTQSNIQTIGFSFSTGLNIRNIFRGAENLEVSAIGSIGSSKDAAIPNDQFFDINEIGANMKLIFPRIFSPFNTDKIIPKYMSPNTRITLAASAQRNIGLDKQSFTGSFNYNWKPTKSVSLNTDIFNVQYVKNLNVANYFGVYQNSFSRLNQIATQIGYIPDDQTLSIPTGANFFINDVLSNNTNLQPNDDRYISVSNISQRKDRLTEDNLIFASNFSFVKDKRDNLFDDDFSIFRVRLELAGNLLSNLAGVFNIKKDASDRYQVFGVAFSQYAKTEIDYVKYYNLGNKNIFAFRTYLGIAVPYGNSTNIPFAKSFFAGGPNDNRAWSAFTLGPGSSKNTNEFNEANLKLMASIEQRFNLLGPLNGALFVDIGNIWNVFDDVIDDAATFDGLGSLRDIAVGTGFGLRYDFNYFVLRGDIGFKTYNPAYDLGSRWFKDYKFGSAVYNIGINYPF